MTDPTTLAKRRLQAATGCNWCGHEWGEADASRCPECGHSDLRTVHQSTDLITLACAMSGEREALTVKAIGTYGVTFTYGPDASVIVRGDDLLRVRAILDQQIANWEMVEA